MVKNVHNDITHNNTFKFSVIIHYNNVVSIIRNNNVVKNIVSK